MLCIVAWWWCRWWSLRLTHYQCLPHAPTPTAPVQEEEPIMFHITDLPRTCVLTRYSVVHVGHIWTSWTYERNWNIFCTCTKITSFCHRWRRFVCLSHRGTGTASAQSVNHKHRELSEEDNPGMLCLFKLMALSLVDISHTHTHTQRLERRFLLPGSPGS